MNSAAPQRILVRGVNWLGDAVMTTPALLRLREKFPAAKITLLTHAKLKDIWSNHPAINDLEIFTNTDSAWTISRRLRPKNFDLGLVLPNSPRSAFELWLAGIPRRVGYARAWRNMFLTQAIPSRPGAVAMRKRSEAEIKQLIQQNAPVTRPPASAHHIYNYLHLTAALGANPESLPPQLAVADAAVAQFAAKFNLNVAGDNAPPFYGLNAGAEYGPAKRWPEERFTEAAIEIQRRTRCRWLIFGLAAEASTAARITTNINRAAGESSAVNLAGATTLTELCAALKLCRLLLANDSGPMHVAAALGTPVIVPFGSTSPEFTGPGLPGDPRHFLLRANAPCSPCFLRECPIDFRCMTGISVAQVVAAVLSASH
jgi:heptosyltransferase-2